MLFSAPYQSLKYWDDACPEYSNYFYSPANAGMPNGAAPNFLIPPTCSWNEASHLPKLIFCAAWFDGICDVCCSMAPPLRSITGKLLFPSCKPVVSEFASATHRFISHQLRLLCCLQYYVGGIKLAMNFAHLHSYDFLEIFSKENHQRRGIRLSFCHTDTRARGGRHATQY
jgi:hypothetical protein